MEIMTFYLDIFEVEVVSENGLLYKNEKYNKGETLMITDSEYRILNSVIPNLYELIRVIPWN